MAGSKETAKKARATMVAKYGGEEGYREFMRGIASRGGTASFSGKGFAGMDKEKLREAGRKGGLKSKRRKANG